MSVVVAFLFLFIVSKNSPIYPMNDWQDVNCFFTVGRGILDGKVPYLDFCEQKGPLLYYTFALAALVSSSDFIGVFIMEVICFAAFLFFSAEIVEIYRGRMSVMTEAAALIFLTFATTVSIAFIHGGSVEELCLFMPTASLAMVLRHMREGSDIGNFKALIIGIFTGVVFWSKFTISGFFLGLFASIAVYYVKRRRCAALWSNMGCCAIGMAAVTAPVLIYLNSRGALDSMFEMYFYNNIFLYPDGAHIPVLRVFLPILNTAVGILACVLVNGISGVLISLCLHRIWRNRKAPSDDVLTAAISFLALTFFTFFGGKFYFPYYSLILLAFAPLGLAMAIKIFDKKTGWISGGKIRLPMTAAALAVMLILAFFFSPNTYLLQYKRSDMPQYRFAERINSKEDATLLNYAFLDGGFYTASGTIPNNRYFCRLNMNLEEMDREQRRMVEECRVDYVVTRGMRLEDSGIDASHYYLVDAAEMPYEVIIWRYYLYELRK